MCPRRNVEIDSFAMSVPDRIWNINELTEEELRDLHIELDYEPLEERWWEQEPLKMLDLSFNSLTVISDKVQCLTELSTLDLHNNLLEELPSAIGSLRELRVINLSDNKLQSLPTQFYMLEELCELYLKSNHISALEAEIGNLVMLTRMDLSYNSLSELPVGLGYLVRLETLNLCHNMIKELPPDVTSMRSLKTLDVSFNQLDTLPPLGELRKVERIMFQSNNLQEFPDISGCSALTVLHLDNNNIPEIDPQRLEAVGHLKKLTMQSNKIEVIPEEIIKLINLEVFDLSHNNISLIPYCVGILPNLKQFIIEGNDIKNIRGDIIRCGTSRILTHIRQIVDNTSINTRELLHPSAGNSICPDKYVMKNTKLCSLAGQNLQEIPEEALEDAAEASIATIDLSRNKLSELPDKMSAIVTVTDLKLTSNHLASLPEWIGEKFKCLQVLDISKNHLHSLPSSIGCLKYLRDIDLSFNRFTELPEAIYDVVSLESLIVNDNLIMKIDVPLLEKLRRLAVLNLSNNNIAHVPPELGNLQHIRNLSLSGNCFKYPRQAILMKDTEEILSYLRNLIPQ
ncbi:PREDICTED: leucine-rich repeat-containing protein 40-like isoform X2 [Vollenhovia emeryi]|uniref:leucine-rich repeat-containing protein 40-like isoform X2 n=1 Tax=Vollenhovia emeryi TaxID=411798 RepID=UPI0005F395F6|nr:PREDICTED: leucine-rich repeat-containing protein 40-like isoform X2 [Vollenhovia emeryi]XP_011881578.1 PREDICTED: leucine-rich repeat-containing protein 40-like isoform X2 [Vollenhovia emeryi]XP_011881579.1 PREDICTED: leucine-rich repeat-containing protein 40-like isoform X2 [Vollenhovia emeryi]